MPFYFLAQFMSSQHNKLFILLALGLPIFLGCFDAMAVGLGLTKIAENFQVSLTTVQWVLSAYMICNAAFTMAAGILCDSYDAKWIFLLGYSLFNLTSLSNALSPTMSLLILSRGIQGISVCMMLISSTNLICIYFQKNTVKYFGYWSFFVGAGTVAGPLLGGVLLHYSGWKSIFMINIYLALILTPFVYFKLPNSKRKKTIKNAAYLPVLINTVLLFSISIIILGINQLTKFELIILLLIIGVLSYLKLRDKILFSILKGFSTAPFLSGALSGACSYYALYTWLVITPLFLQKIYSINDLHTGLIMLPYFITFTIAPVLAGHLGIKVNKKLLVLFGLSFNILGSLLIITFYSLTVWHLMFAFFTFGIGNGFVNTSATALALEKVPLEFTGKATAILYASKWISGALGACVATVTWVEFSSPFVALYIAGGACLLSVILIQPKRDHKLPS